MEDSLSSYSNGRQDDVMVEEEEEEESGWTTYFDDFFDSQNRSNKDHDHHQQRSEFLDHDDQSFGGGTKNSSSETSCLVSDAASYVEYWKRSSNNKMISNALFGGASPKFSKKLKFKKTRTKEISYDDSLEDTASSPVNSPKVGSLKEMEINQRKADHDCVESPMRQVRGFNQQLELQLQTSDESRNHQMGYQGDQINYPSIINDDRRSNNLRKKGMCLVPVSMFANYLG